MKAYCTAISCFRIVGVTQTNQLDLIPGLFNSKDEAKGAAYSYAKDKYPSNEGYYGYLILSIELDSVPDIKNHFENNSFSMFLGKLQDNANTIINGDD